ncbi:uncharacterized protein LOC131634957 [Vicia villosa]|uniref:uncharacterized protein LOC131634957 n=1 Tax=Vicia villosa TaxID=3911 RepID=UPI00273BD06E|nr:uncharacterized protein LOC131634957 [Vicia villosa]
MEEDQMERIMRLATQRKDQVEQPSWSYYMMMLSLCFQDPKKRFFPWTILVPLSLICAAYFFGNALSQNEYKQRLARWGLIYSTPITKSNACKTQCHHLSGTHSLPQGILATTSDLETRSLWASAAPNNKNSNRPLNLLAIPVGIKQKQVVDKIVKKVVTLASLISWQSEEVDPKRC